MGGVDTRRMSRWSELTGAVPLHAGSGNPQHARYSPAPRRVRDSHVS
jgi:hypothetical protein